MSDHYFLRASSDFSVVVSSSEDALRKLAFQFIQNQTKDLVEFEVLAPKYFRIVVERRSDPEVQTLLLRSIKRASGTSIDIRFDQSEVYSDARLFLKILIKLLPVSPWSGLRMLESVMEKKKWLELTG